MMDQRKHSDESTNKKRTAAGARNKPIGVFVPRKTKKTDALQMRIDKVVALALAQGRLGTGRDVFVQSKYRMRLACCAHKLG